MKRSFFVLVMLGQVALGQGWQQLGPDSVNWRESYYLTGRWLPNSTFHLAASTSNGVAIYSNAGTWNYALRHIPETIVNNGVSYALLEFSPWEPDSCFVGHYIAYTEADLHIRKVRFPPQFPPVGGGAGGSCWLGPLSVVFPPNNDSIVFVGVCGIQKSTDRGLTWQNVMLESPWGLSRLVGVDRSDPHILYRATEEWSSRVLYRSTDSGVSWDSLFSPLSLSAYYGRSNNLIAHGDTILLGMRSYPSDTSGTGAIVRSTNGGTTWSITYNQGRILGLTSAALATYAAATAGIIRSTDWGLTWAPFNNALPTTGLTSLVADPNGDTMYVSTTTHGVLKVWRFTTGIDDGQGLHPTGFALHQNYPNPFNPTTKIVFDLPQRSHTFLAVYDLLGRQVKVLVDGIQERGTHEASFNTTTLGSGVYFYRLRVGGLVQTKKMILQK